MIHAYEILRAKAGVRDVPRMEIGEREESASFHGEILSIRIPPMSD